jgi:sulfite exporter TauE/SafE
VVIAKKRAPTALVLGGVLAAAGGVAVNRVGGSGLQKAAAFAVACALLIAAGLLLAGAAAVRGLGCGPPTPRVGRGS